MTSLQYSEITFDKKINTNNDICPFESSKLISKNHNKTIKKNNFDMSELFEKIHKKDRLEDISTNLNTNLNNKMSDFIPLENNEENSMINNSNILSNKEILLNDRINDYNDNYYSSIPSKNELNTIDNNKDLLYKLNYIITLLEEQHDEKTNNIMEEIILYTFLGIFIIYIIDSFARVSKYVR